MIPTFTAEEICHLSQIYYVTNLCHLHNGLLKLVTQLLQPSEGRFTESLTNINCKSENESEVAQSCQTLCDPMDCSLPGSSVHGTFQAIVLESIAISLEKTWREFFSYACGWKMKRRGTVRSRPPDTLVVGQEDTEPQSVCVAFLSV